MTTQTESFPLLSHVVIWAHVVLTDSFSVTKPLMSAGDKNGPGIIISSPACAEYWGFHKKRGVSKNLISFKEQKITRKYWSPKRDVTAFNVYLCSYLEANEKQ